MILLLASFVSGSEWKWLQIGTLSVGDSLMDQYGNEVLISSIEEEDFMIWREYK